MVMEDTNDYLNAQVVGREFVRQYYTLMNEAPKYLHRFYSANSSFIHGGVERPGQEAQPVLGQNEIYKKIESLDFKDCHAKIRQVDSQSTVSSAVVVQVTGELSNKGGPMRRFMQTFVLAPQTPKQYYVHNDIFRYQDEVFQDPYDSEEEIEQVANEHVQENGIADDYEPTPDHHERVMPVMPEPTKQEALVQQPHNSHAAVIAADQETVTTGTPSDLTTTTKLSPVTNRQSPHTEPEATPMQQMEDLNSDSTKEAETEPEPQPEPEKAKPVVEEVPAEPATPKTFSWANVAAGGNSAAVAVVNPMSTSSTNVPTALPLAVIASQQQMEESTNSVSVTEERPPVSSNNPPQPRSNRASAEPGQRRPPRNDEAYGERRNEKYPDTQQVFVGNLPMDIAEFDLRKFFNQWGKVIECRINRGQPGNKVPFGFVVFDTEDPVKVLLGLKRVEMDGHRLNVEEKKARAERTGSSGRDRPPRGQRPNRNPRPKDRENSGTRHDSKPHNKGGFGGGGGGSGGSHSRRA